MRYLATVNPVQLHEQPLHSHVFTVLCAGGMFGIMDPFFFENDNGKTVLVSAEHYITMLQSCLLLRLEALSEH